MKKDLSISKQRREKIMKGEDILDHSKINFSIDQKCEMDAAKLRHYPSLASYFEDQINLIKDSTLKAILVAYLNIQPKYKMEKPTSSTGKYHPQWQNGGGGNGRHTKNVVKVLQVFERAYPNLKWDEIYTASILHDMGKYQDPMDEHTHMDHPIVESKKFFNFYKRRLKEEVNFYGLPNNAFSFKTKRKIKFICHLIYWHDGRFNCTFADKEKIKNNYTKGLKSKMKHEEAYLLHLADMISANKPLWEELF